MWDSSYTIVGKRLSTGWLCFLHCLQTCSEVYSHNMMSKRVWNKYLHNHQSCHHRLSCQVGPPRAVPPSSSQVKTGKQHWSRRRNIPSSSLIISISHYHLLAGLWGFGASFTTINIPQKIVKSPQAATQRRANNIGADGGTFLHPRHQHCIHWWQILGSHNH